MKHNFLLIKQVYKITQKVIMVKKLYYNQLLKGQWERYDIYIYIGWFGFTVFNTTFNNISVMLWRSVLLVEERGGPGENH